MVSGNIRWMVELILMALGLALHALEWRSNNYVYELDKC